MVNTKEELAKYMVPSIVEVNVSKDQIDKFVISLKSYPFKAVAVDLFWAGHVKEILQDTSIYCVASIAYPDGGTTLKTKKKQIKTALEMGIPEVDVSLAYINIKSGKFDRVTEEVKSLLEVSEGDMRIVVIPQLPILTNDEKAKVCEAIIEGGINRIKAATGFGYQTTPEDILLIKRLFGDEMSVEAAGGLRPISYTLKILESGTDTLHISTPLQLLEEFERNCVKGSAKV